MSEKEKSPEELDAIFAEIQEAWDSAPCKVIIFYSGDEVERIAWKRELSPDEKVEVAKWAQNKFIPLEGEQSILALWWESET